MDAGYQNVDGIILTGFTGLLSNAVIEVKSATTVAGVAGATYATVNQFTQDALTGRYYQIRVSEASGAGSITDPT